MKKATRQRKKTPRQDPIAINNVAHAMDGERAAVMAESAPHAVDDPEVNYVAALEFRDATIQYQRYVGKKTIMTPGKGETPHNRHWRGLTELANLAHALADLAVADADLCVIRARGETVGRERKRYARLMDHYTGVMSNLCKLISKAHPQAIEHVRLMTATPEPKKE